jgi:hypothetical protein
MIIDLQIPTLPLKMFRLTDSVYNINLLDCEISTWAGMCEQGSVQGFIIFSGPQKQHEKYVSEYLSFK